METSVPSTAAKLCDLGRGTFGRCTPPAEMRSYSAMLTKLLWCHVPRPLHPTNHDTLLAALKTYDRQKCIDSGRSNQVLREKNTLMKLNCPYIIQLIDSDKDDKCLYLYLEPVLGGSLHLHLRHSPGGRMEEEIVRIYVAELLLALQHMRSRCCVHRDIKATNCLLTESGHIKLCDFSASKAFSDEVDKDVHRTYTVIGTVEFMSPELLLRRVGYSYETDLWSLGVLMYEMLLGRRPFAEVHSRNNWLTMYSAGTTCSEMGEALREELMREFYDTQCRGCLLSPADTEGKDCNNEFDLIAEPMSPEAWSLLTEGLLVVPDTQRINLDHFEKVEALPFFSSVDWPILRSLPSSGERPPPIRINNKLGPLGGINGSILAPHLGLAGSRVGGLGDFDETEDLISEEQQKLFSGF